MRKKYNKYEVSLPQINFSKLFIFIVVGAIFYYFITSSIIKYFVLRHQYLKLRTHLQEIKNRNKWLQNEIYLIQTDTATVEFYIRKNLYYKKPKEKVIIFKPIIKKQTKNLK
ncbi:MAG: septum formation initiator family protein [Endomicrobia bacterium]|nr:septum formation initiator family protein [Endomicrobiia bacterium]MDW8055746.1 septum formation initiator family protein [Elusimicrobiota bacterium]